MKIKKNFLLLIFFMAIETIFLKTFMYDLLPNKYFLDAGHILGVMNGIAGTDKSYSYVASIFNMINVFGFTNIQQWGYLIAMIFVPILIKCISKYRNYNQVELIFIFAAFTLLNIYVFGISKDIIQFVYFLFIFIILSNKKLKNVSKIILICLVLLLEAYFFRIYYAIMAMLIVTIYFIYINFINEKKVDKKQFVKIIILSFSLFFLEIYVVQLLSYDNYDAILNARYSVNIWRVNDANAATIINDLLGQNTNYLKFIGNYVINFIRLLFPFELIFKGIKQIIFAIYQIFITTMLIKSCKKINYNNCLWIITLLSFIMISTIFEPDFGSFVRHETAAILIVLEVVRCGINDKKIIRKGDDN